MYIFTKPVWFAGEESENTGFVPNVAQVDVEERTRGNRDGTEPRARGQEDFYSRANTREDVCWRQRRILRRCVPR